mmetsp:Transcript_34482/g.98001  ORF Transcript_34482/g.98001 Transcript_34482/m.98001 type:complete len:302 (+) Transcript_34482:409-1314(+)
MVPSALHLLPDAAGRGGPDAALPLDEVVGRRVQVLLEVPADVAVAVPDAAQGAELRAAPCGEALLGGGRLRDLRPVPHRRGHGRRLQPGRHRGALLRMRHHGEDTLGVDGLGAGQERLDAGLAALPDVAPLEVLRKVPRLQHALVVHVGAAVPQLQHRQQPLVAQARRHRDARPGSGAGPTERGVEEVAVLRAREDEAVRRDLDAALEAERAVREAPRSECAAQGRPPPDVVETAEHRLEGLQLLGRQLRTHGGEGGLRAIRRGHRRLCGGRFQLTIVRPHHRPQRVRGNAGRHLEPRCVA